MIGERLRQARLSAGISQEQLVEKMAKVNYLVTKQAISTYEKNQSIVPTQFLALAADILHVPNGYFASETQIQKEAIASPESKRFNVYDLIALPPEEQERILAEVFERASHEEFEVFEADEIYEYPEDDI
jgi:transcriptional regulator with XRE-family HTH domain